MAEKLVQLKKKGGGGSGKIYKVTYNYYVNSGGVFNKSYDTRYPSSGTATCIFYMKDGVMYSDSACTTVLSSFAMGGSAYQRIVSSYSQNVPLYCYITSITIEEL